MFRTRSSKALIALVVLMTLGAPARRALAIEWLPDTPFESNPGSPSELSTLPDGAGGLFLVWVQSAVDIRAQRVDADGNRLWGANGISVCSATGIQNQIRIAADGAGGLLVTWRDTRTNSTGDIFVQRIQANGSAVWPTDGVALTSSVVTRNTPDIVSDGSGGAIAVWAFNLGNPDIAVRAINASGTPQGPADGTTICAATGSQTVPRISGDGAGGAIVTWQDGRTSPSDVYAARFTSAGTIPWTADGVVVLANSTTVTVPQIVADGSGGAIIVLMSTSGPSLIYAFHLDGSGTHLWSTAGVQVSFASGQSSHRILADGTGGVFVTAATGVGVLAQRLDTGGSRLWGPIGVIMGSGIPSGMALDGSGNLLATWTDGPAIRAQQINPAATAQWAPTLSGLLIKSTGGIQPGIAPDGAGGALLAWMFNDDIYGMRVLAGGVLPYLSPSLDVADLPADEGGYVRLSVDMNTADLYATTPEETGFAVWRRIALPAGPNVANTQSGDIVDALRRSRLEPVRLSTAAAAAAGFPPGTWEVLGSYPSLQIRNYSVAAPTRADYTGNGNVDEVFLVVTHTTVPSTWYVSAPDSGHSVDNLPPSAPQALAGTLTSPTALHITWTANSESDLHRYAIYRGGDAGFVPSGANRLGYATSPTFDDPAFAAGYYKVSAIDRHGNESAYSLLPPSQVTGVPPGSVPAIAFLAPPAPNPVATPCVFQFGLSRDGRVDLQLFDVTGRRVVALRGGNEVAGVHLAPWNLTDERGQRVSAGLYWALLVAEGRSITRRLVVSE